MLLLVALIPLVLFALPISKGQTQDSNQTISQKIKSINQQKGSKILKTIESQKETLTFDYCCIAYTAGNGTTQLLDNYKLIVKDSQGNIGNLFLHNVLKSGNKIPAGQYTFNDTPEAFSIDKGYLMWGFIPKSSFININNSIKSVCSGTIDISYTNSNTINIVFSMKDISDVVINATCTYTENVTDYYKLEPTEIKSFTSAPTSKTYDFYADGINEGYSLSKLHLENNDYNLNLAIRRPKGTQEIQIPDGTYNVESNSDNSVIYSLGERDAHELSVLYNNDLPYYITGGSVNVVNTGKIMSLTINVTTFAGSNINITTSIDVTNYLHRLEPTNKSQFTEKILGLTFDSEKNYQNSNLTKYALEFESSQSLYYFYILSSASTTDIPNGTYTFNTSNQAGSGIASIGIDGNGNNTGSVIGTDLDLNTGLLKSFYYIESGSLTIEDDPRGNGKLYTIDVVSHFKSTWKSTYSTWKDPEIPFNEEPKEIKNYSTDFSEATISHTQDDGTKGMDYYRVDFTEGNSTMNILLFNSSNNTKEIPEGTYTLNQEPTINGILASKGKNDNQSYSLSIAVMSEQTTKKNIYFLKSGTIKVSYPNTANKNIIHFEIDIVSHNGSTFKMNCTTTLDPDYAFRKEDENVMNYTNDTFAFFSYSKTSKPLASLANYNVIFSNLSGDNVLSIVLFGDASSKSIPAGTYTFSNSRENATALTSEGVDSEGKISLSIALMKNPLNKDNPLYYFIKTGTIIVTYPDPNNTNRVKFDVDIKSHFNSTFIFTLDYTINPMDAQYDYETRIQSNNTFSFDNLEIQEGTQENALYPHNLHFTNDKNKTAYLRILTESKEIPTGTYTVSDQKENFTLVKSIGLKDESLEFSLCGDVNDKGSFTNVYFITSGTLTITQDASTRTYTAKLQSYFGSTFSFSYAQILSNIEDKNLYTWGAYKLNESIQLQDLVVGESIKIYDTLGKLVYNQLASNSNMIITQLQRNQLYIIHHNNNIIKISL